ncbi:glycosyltransferase [Microbacterium sp. GXF7504]
MRALLGAALRESQTGDGRIVVLTAIDDYPRALLLLALRLRVARRTHTIFVRYRVDDYREVQPRRGFRQIVKKFYFDLARAIAGASVAVFDERLEGRSGVHVLPDPWTGPFGTFEQAEARRVLNIPAGERVVLLVGYQDRRKGFPFAVDLLLGTRSRDKNTRLWLVGGVAPEYAHQLDSLREAFGSDFVHEAAYITDVDLAHRMAAADVVLMPYAPEFLSTSGVLVRAAASGTRVLATDHGLVGWRVSTYSLGTVVPYGDLQSGIDALARLLEAEAAPGASEFAESSTRGAVSRRFAAVLRQAQSK